MRPALSGLRAPCLLLFVALLTFTLAGCQRSERITEETPSASTADQDARVLAKARGVKPLRVGVAESAPPLIFKEDGKTVGLEADFARALGEDLGREVQLVSIWWPDLMFELRKGHIDIIMAGMSITPQRQERVTFCTPYMTVGQQALIRAADAAKFPDRDAVRRCEGIIGVETGSTGEGYARANLLLGRVQPFRSLDAAVEALERREIDMVIHDGPMVRWIALRSKVQVQVHVNQEDRERSHELIVAPGLLTQEQLAWATRPGDTKLREQMNMTLARWRSTGRLNNMIRQWLPDYSPSP